MRRRFGPFALFAALAMIINIDAAPCAGASLQESSQASRPATARLKAYLDAFNSGSPDKLREFFLAHYAESALKETSVEQRLGRYSATKARLPATATS